MSVLGVPPLCCNACLYPFSHTTNATVDIFLIQCVPGSLNSVPVLLDSYYRLPLAHKVWVMLGEVQFEQGLDVLD